MPNGINLAIYHRGDGEGNACKALMHNALKIFSEIKKFLIVTVAGGDEDTKTKIKEVYDAVTCCLMLFHGFLSAINMYSIQLWEYCCTMPLHADVSGWSGSLTP